MASTQHTNRLTSTARWLARVGGTCLLVYWTRHAVYELAALLEERLVYGERLFSLGFLAMMLGVLVGWLSDRVGAGLLIAGYLLAAGAPVLGTSSRLMLAEDALGVARVLLPFLVVGVAYAYAGKTRTAFS